MNAAAGCAHPSIRGTFGLGRMMNWTMSQDTTVDTDDVTPTRGDTIRADLFEMTRVITIIRACLVCVDVVDLHARYYNY